ncbi:hypothetical protein LguiB_032112 [Lonicera macranthoides]
MEAALGASSLSSFQFKTHKTILPKTLIHNLPVTQPPTSPFSSSSVHTSTKSRKFKIFSTISPTQLADSTKEETRIHKEDEKFDWFSQWYPVMPVCDLDKRAPMGKKVMGIDIVVWWDRNENEWKVFEDSCPHRLAPLSEGRIDQWGRLQCVYHGWCFGGAGDCKFIPQAPRDGPPIHSSKKACVAVYPSTVQNGIVWFWPNSDPQYKDILTEKKPPYIPELDDPSYTKSMGNRDIAYGYEVLTENLMDPAHVPYAHYGILTGPRPKNSVKADREGGRPLDMNVTKLDINGFTAKQQMGENTFIPPCLFYGYINIGGLNKGTESASSAETTKVQQSSVPQRRTLLIFYCVPVSPGYSRLIFSFPRNFGVWIDRVVPRWMFHVGQNLILDSDLYLLHVEERKIMEVGPSNWQKACFVPTKADALVVAFRKWLKRYAGGQIDWQTKFGQAAAALPATLPKEQLLDRYWTHVVNCSSCNMAYKGLNALEVVLQVIAVASIGIVAVAKQGLISAPLRITLVSMAVLCFIASRWLSHFIYKNFHFHDYNHAFR